MPEESLGQTCPMRIHGCRGPLKLTGEDAKKLLGVFYIKGAALIVCGLMNHSDMTGTAYRCEQTLLLNNGPGFDDLDIDIVG